MAYRTELPACVAAAALLVAWPARAAHPLQTEDTATQGARNVEFENGFEHSREAGVATLTYSPQLSFGASTTLDLIVQPSTLQQRTPDGLRVRGWGDTNLDAKWRFYGDAPWSLGLRAGLALPTSTQGLGLRHGTLSAHALLVLSIDAAPWTVHANLGYTRNPAGDGQRRGLGHVSSAAMWAAGESLILTLEAAADASADAGRSSWPATLLLGAIYTVQPGLDLDLVWQSSTRGTAVSRSVLLGLTWRFGL